MTTTPPATNPDRPHRRELVALGLAGIGLRGAVALLVCWRLGLSLDQYARLYDGNSYLITAGAMLGQSADFNAYHGRVFAGFPAIVALLGWAGVPLAWGALLINWLSAAAASMMAAVIFRDARVGWATSLLFPHYLMNSSLAMSEAPMMALLLGAMLLATRTSIGAGALAGLSMLVRPMAIFGAAALVLRDVLARRYRPALLLTLTGGLVLTVGLLLLAHWRGDALANMRYQAQHPNAYGGQLFAWPFEALVRVPMDHDVPPARVAYVWAHVIVVLIGCAIALRHWRSADARWRLALPWLIGNTAFILTLGSVWAFECFHRFTVPAAPALWFALCPVLPRRMWAWGVIAISSGAVAVLTIQP